MIYILISSPCNGGHRLRLLSFSDFGQMLRGEFHNFLPLLSTSQQFSVLRSLCTIPHHSIFHMLNVLIHYHVFGDLSMDFLNSGGLSSVNYTPMPDGMETARCPITHFRLHPELPEMLFKTTFFVLVYKVPKNPSHFY